MKNIIQIAGARDLQEALMLIDCGVDFLGFPLYVDVNEEDLTEDETAEIINNLPAGTNTVLITYLTEAENVLQASDYSNPSVLQLHGNIEPDELKRLKVKMPNKKLIKSLIVKENNLAELQDHISVFSPWVDFFITDTHDPVTGATGATGKVHDWQISRKLVEISPRPVILAGGLNPLNVADAINTVKPAGVDSHSGVEKIDGIKDPQLVRDFVREARKAFDKIHIAN